MSSVKPIDAPPPLPSRPGLTFHEFVEGTTFHGIKNIFDKNYSLPRKIIWLFVVLGIVTLFAYQIGSRIRDYYQYETAVDVEVIYAGKLNYPTVTICNQNKFKLTKAASLGIFDFIQDFYGIETDERFKANSSLTSKSVINTTKIYKEAGHQKNDFIYACSWAGRKCTDYDITETITEYGICYTFNSILAGNQTELLTVSESGMTNALSLLLNLEQYQYMPGPDNDAGVKMFLHNDYLRPLMYDLGFAIAAGTHSLVGVKRIESYSMAAPYGECVESKYKSHAECVDDCRMNIVSERCKCVPFEGLGIISVTKEIPLCNISDNLLCAEYQMRNVKKDKNLCSCSVPCSQIVYDPALSFSSISTFSADKVVLGDLTSRRKLELSLLRAKEHGEVYFSQKKFNNEDLMKKFINEFNLLVSETEKIELIINNASEYKMKIIPDIEQLLSILRIDMGTTEMNKEAAEKAQTDDSFENLEDNFEDIVKKLKNDWDIILHYDEKTKESKLINDIENCIISNGNVTTNVWNCDEVIPIGGGGGLGPTSPPKTKPYWEPLEEIFNKFSHIFQSLNSGKSQYDDKFISTFGKNATKNNSSMSSNYENCIEILNSSSELSKKILVGIDAMKNENATLADKLLGAQYFLEGYLKFSNEDAMEKPLEKHCFYFAEDDVWEKIKLQTGKFYSSFTQSQTALSNIKTLLNETKTVTNRIGMLNDKMEKFYKQTTYNPSLTKKSIYELMKSTIMEKDFGVMSSLVYSISVTISAYTETAAQQEIIPIIREASDSLNRHISWQFAGKFSNQNTTTTTPIPLLFPNFVKRYVNENIIGSICENGDWRMNKIADCSEILLNVYTNSINQIMENLGKIYYNFEKNKNNLLDDLDNYGSDLKVDATFFIQNFAKIDVFYKELSYQKIQQLQKFSTLSLFSEIGGFMGLLLGASVLTVCEWLDFLCVKALLHIVKKEDNSLLFNRSENNNMNNLGAYGGGGGYGSGILGEKKGNIDDGYGSKNGMPIVEY